MIMNAVVAVALGLTPVQAGKDIQQFAYRPQDYASLLGGYRQSVDRHGVTHLDGVDRLTGRRFALAVARSGRVEGTVGETYLSFTIEQRA